MKFAQIEFCWKKRSEGRERAVEYLWAMREKDEMGPKILWNNSKVWGCSELNIKTIPQDHLTNFIIY